MSAPGPRWTQRLARRLGGQGAALGGLVALALVVVGTAAGGVRARALLEATRDDVHERLSLADLELRLPPVEPGVLARTRLPAGVAAAEERGVALGRAEGPRLAPLPVLLRRLPADPPQVDRLEVRPGGRYPAPDEPAVLVERSLADVGGVSVGDRLTLTLGATRLTLPVVGVALSPEHLLAPVHPAAPLPMKGSAGAVFVSAAAVRDLPRLARVNAIRVRLAPGADPVAVEAALVAALPERVRESVPATRDTGRHLCQLLLAQLGVYLPVVVGTFGAVGLLLLALVVARGIDRRQREAGLRRALGHRPLALARALAGPELLAVAVGALVGAAVHGPVAHAVAGGWARAMGFPPLTDPGAPLGALALTTLACLLTAALAAAVPLLWVLGRSPAALLHASALPAAGPRGLLRGAARLAAGLRLPPAAALALAGVTRRRRETLGAVLGVGLAVTLVLALHAVHVSHRVAAEASVERAVRSALVRFAGEPDAPGGAGPVDGATVPEAAVGDLARALAGTAEPLLGGPVRLGAGRGAPGRLLLGAPVAGVLARLPLVAGRAPAAEDASEALVDMHLAGELGLGVGSRLTLFADADAPEGLEVEVVGVLDGLSMGRLLVPLGAAQGLLGTPGRVNGALLDSALPDDELARRLDARSDLASRFTRAQGLAHLDAAARGSLGVLRLALGTALGVALLLLLVLALQDGRDRAPERALLDALGWRARRVALVAVLEVWLRGALALALATLLAAPAARAFLARLETANGYSVPLVLPWADWARLLLAALLLLPLAALPALRRARGAPAPLLRTLEPA